MFLFYTTKIRNYLFFFRVKTVLGDHTKKVAKRHSSYWLRLRTQLIITVLSII